MFSFLARRFLPENADTKTTRNVYGYICGGVGIFLNIVLFCLKLFVGIISSSIAIIADAFNNLTDAGSSVISLFGFILSKQKADSKHPFGHGRIEYIAGTIISVAIILVGVELLQSSVKNIFRPQEFVFNKFVIIILAISILIKLYMAHYNRKIGRKIQSASLCAVATDSISDSVATLAILLSSVSMHLWDIHIDGYAGALVSFLIIKSGISSLIDTSSPLLGGAPDSEFVKKVKKIVLENPQTIGIHDLVVHDYGPNKVFVTLHMEVDGRGEMFALHDAVDLTERRIFKELGCEAVIHMDPIDVDNPVLKVVYAVLSEKCRTLSIGADIHDLRVVPGPTHTNIIFDLILPPEDFSRKEDICSQLQECVQNINDNYYAVITAETSYI